MAWYSSKRVISKSRYLDIKLLIVESAVSIITLLSTNITYLRDNTVYIVTLFLIHFRK